MHSIGRVLGDRNVLYKYVNPNLLAVLTAGGDAAAQANSLSLYLIDVVAGRIVHSQTHRRCGQPVTLVHSEHWIVVSIHRVLVIYNNATYIFVYIYIYIYI
ncbi:unnamed protein product [Protopolystoma xenopodis]|uniref:Uncharacterized protein n=1 Tax=Protopolystoma xenopodis TaxID=117903 RepID=A0A448X2S2_9PLAT|nr:unnamed protein product [Protopolystoma xenopodis]